MNNYQLLTAGQILICLLITFFSSAQISPESDYCFQRSSNCPKFLRASSFITPSFNAKGDVVLGVAMTSKALFFERFDGKEYQLGYSPMKGLGLILSGEFFRDNFHKTIVVGSTKIEGPRPLGGSTVDRYDDLEYDVKGRMTNLALGYYKNLGQNIFWDSYLSYGKGKFEIDPEFSAQGLESDTRKVSLRTSINYRWKFLEFGANYSFTSQKFMNIEGDVLEDDVNYLGNPSQNLYLSERDKHLISEAGVNVNFHIKNFKLFIHLIEAWNHKHPEFRMYNKAINIGVQYRFNTKA